MTTIEIQPTDLRNITNSDSCLTTVDIRMGEWWDPSKDQRWLTFGRAQLRRFGDNDFPYWQLGAYFKEGATDFSHSRAYALRFTLMGLNFDCVINHYSVFKAMVHPNMPDDFRVPLPGYNPLEKAEPCPHCKSEHAHVMVPEGSYVPPFDQELWEIVRGRQVSIYIGVPFE